MRPMFRAVSLRRIVTVGSVLTFCLSVFLLLTPASFAQTASLSAADAEALQKLRPLSPAEATMYEKIENNSAELHSFIVTRTYVRLVLPIIKQRDSTFDIHHVRRYPPRIFQDLPRVPEDVDPDYTSAEEAGLLYRILLEEVVARQL